MNLTLRKPHPPVFILVDGHNLAFYMYHLPPGQRLSPSLAQRMVNTFVNYRKEFPEFPLEIELCFDGGIRPQSQAPEGIRVLAAGPKNKADYLVIDRFRFHQFSGHACLVITNDQEIQEKITQEGGVFLSNFDFVLASHPEHPVLLPPDDLPLEELEQAHHQEIHRSESDETALAYAIHRFSSLKKPHSTRRKFLPRHVLSTASSTPASPNEATPTANQDMDASKALASPQPHYTISMKSWPVQTGIRFLMTSFCERHRPAFISLLSEFDLNQLRPQDLSVLADFLLSSCGDEPDFTRRGSLMDRVRLALLKAGPAGLDLSSLADRIGLKPEGLHGRIKRKANGWLVYK